MRREQKSSILGTDTKNHGVYVLTTDADGPEEVTPPVNPSPERPAGLLELDHPTYFEAAIAKSNYTMDTFKMASGDVAYGACRNFEEEYDTTSSAVCPYPLQIVGCSCEDKLADGPGGCGTHFDLLQMRCFAYTKAGYTIKAIARCCYMDWAKNWTHRTGTLSDGTKGAFSGVSCDTGQAAQGTRNMNLKAIGCACRPKLKNGEAARKNGCQLVEMDGANSCMATNAEDHNAGVEAEILCAEVPGSFTWEIVTSHVQRTGTNLSCSSPYLHMVSCSCGSLFGQCSGGKVVNNKCVCNGLDCNATARCGNIPIPPSDCQWNNWGEWTDCSVSCGSGTQARVRTKGALATHGGVDCTGDTNMTKACKSDGNSKECGNHTYKKEAIEASEGEGTTTIMIVMCVVIGVVALMAIGIYCWWVSRHDMKEHGFDDDDDGIGKGWGKGAAPAYGAASGAGGKGGGGGKDFGKEFGKGGGGKGGGGKEGGGKADRKSVV